MNFVIKVLFVFIYLTLFQFHNLLKYKYRTYLKAKKPQSHYTRHVCKAFQVLTFNYSQAAHGLSQFKPLENYNPT